MPICMDFGKSLPVRVYCDLCSALMMVSMALPVAPSNKLKCD